VHPSATVRHTRELLPGIVGVGGSLSHSAIDALAAKLRHRDFMASLQLLLHTLRWCQATATYVCNTPTVLAPLVALLYEADTDVLTLCILCVREVVLAWSRSDRSQSRGGAAPRIPVERLAQIASESSVPNASAASLVLAALPADAWAELSLPSIISSIPSLFEPASFLEGEEFAFRQGLGVDPTMVGLFDGPVLLLKKALSDTATDTAGVLAAKWPQRLVSALASTLSPPPVAADGEDTQVRCLTYLDSPSTRAAVCCTCRTDVRS
jgi:hypothetical protein